VYSSTDNSLNCESTQFTTYRLPDFGTEACEYEGDYLTKPVMVSTNHVGAGIEIGKHGARLQLGMGQQRRSSFDPANSESYYYSNVDNVYFCSLQQKRKIDDVELHLLLLEGGKNES
jgi:hypothetical protein